MKAKIGLITLGVADVKQSLIFYRDGLGFQTHNYNDGDEAVFFKLEGSWLSIYPREKNVRSWRKTLRFQPKVMVFPASHWRVKVLAASRRYRNIVPFRSDCHQQPLERLLSQPSLRYLRHYEAAVLVERAHEAGDVARSNIRRTRRIDQLRDERSA
jgi:hypothetical protein